MPPIEPSLSRIAAFASAKLESGLVIYHWKPRLLFGPDCICQGGHLSFQSLQRRPAKSPPFRLVMQSNGRKIAIVNNSFPFVVIILSAFWILYGSKWVASILNDDSSYTYILMTGLLISFTFSIMIRDAILFNKGDIIPVIKYGSMRLRIARAVRYLASVTSELIWWVAIFITLSFAIMTIISSDIIARFTNLGINDIRAISHNISILFAIIFFIVLASAIVLRRRKATDGKEYMMATDRFAGLESEPVRFGEFSDHVIRTLVHISKATKRKSTYNKYLSPLLEGGRVRSFWVMMKQSGGGFKAAYILSNNSKALSEYCEAAKDHVVYEYNERMYKKGLREIKDIINLGSTGAYIDHKKAIKEKKDEIRIHGSLTGYVYVRAGTASKDRVMVFDNIKRTPVHDGKFFEILESEKDFNRSMRFNSAAGIPLIYGGDKIGVLMCYDTEIGGFRDIDTDAVIIYANLLSIALRRAVDTGETLDRVVCDFY